MADYPAQAITRGGLVPTMHPAAGGGDTVPVGENVYLMIANGSGGAITATVVTPVTEGGLAVADLAVVVAAGATSLVGPLPADLFQNPNDHKAHVSWSATALVTFAVLAA